MKIITVGGWSTRWNLSIADTLIFPVMGSALISVANLYTTSSCRWGTGSRFKEMVISGRRGSTVGVT